MSTYLINGPSGSGKTSIGVELQKRGFSVINTDEEFGYYADLETEEDVDFPGKLVSLNWYSKNGWIWNRAKVERALDSASETTFLCGGSLNEAEFYPCFEKIFRLTIDPGTLVERLQNRGDDNHTNNPEFIAKMLKMIETTRADAEKSGMTIIDTSKKNIDESVAELLSHIE